MIWKKILIFFINRGYVRQFLPRMVVLNDKMKRRLYIDNKVVRFCFLDKLERRDWLRQIKGCLFISYKEWKGTMCLITDEKHKTIYAISDSIEGFERLLGYFRSCRSINQIELKIAQYNVEQLLRKVELQSQLGGDHAFERDGIVLTTFICPDKIIYNDEGISVAKPIPFSNREIYRKLFIELDSKNRIVNVRILDENGNHPNCDGNGWYCVGILKHKEYNEENKNKLIKQISVYNMVHAYKIPEKLRGIV